MRFVVIGAGAIGAYIGALMARAGVDVTLFARGPHMMAMRDEGVRVVEGDREFVVKPQICDSIESIGPADVVILGVKAHSLPALAPELKNIFHSETTVVSTQNGIPWWYFQGHDGGFDGLELDRVDPGGVVAEHIHSERVLGSIIYFSTEITKPGVIKHIEGNRLSLGEPEGSRSDRCRAVAELLNKAGLKCRVTTRIRHELWIKLLGNVALNPTSVLTGSTIARMLDNDEVLALTRRIMEEVMAVASKLGLELPISVDQRIAGAQKVGEHKTSMLQDFEQGRPMELEAVVGSVVEIAHRLGVPIPCTETVYSCTKLLAQRSHA